MKQLKLLLARLMRLLVIGFTACSKGDDETFGDREDNAGVTSKHEAVDLGLSVKWATCNVGANNPEEFGDYFAWGETEPKSAYTTENSKTYGKIIGDISGNPEYDAATANWGGSWRMPTRAEIQELISYSTWTWTTQNSVPGYKVTSPNGNSIFLPAAGCRYGSSLFNAGSNGYYWSSPPYELTYYACSLRFFGGDYYYYWIYRINGLSVRPVIK